MATPFTPRANLITKLVLAGIAIGIIGLGVVEWAYTFSSFRTRVGLYVDQTVPFSHEHHVSGLGIDCRFCHVGVEDSAFAGLPATGTCMNCHWQLWTNAELLAPVRESWQTGKPLVWNGVNALPDYVYFRHDVHVNKGVGCATCHGHVEHMPLMQKAETLYMRWCINCHEHPENYLRPRSEVFNGQYQAPANQTAVGRKLMQDYAVDVTRLMNCSICHR